MHMHALASFPGSLAHSRGGRGTKRESLVHIVCACTNFIQIGVILHKLYSSRQNPYSFSVYYLMTPRMSVLSSCED